MPIDISLRAGVCLHAGKRSGAVSLTLRQNRPGDPGHLIGHGHRSNIHVRALLQIVRPLRYRRRSVAYEMQNRSRHG